MSEFRSVADEFIIMVADRDEALFIRADRALAHFDFVDYLNRDTVFAHSFVRRVGQSDSVLGNRDRSSLNDFILYASEELVSVADQVDDCDIVLVMPTPVSERLQFALPDRVLARVTHVIETDMTHCTIAEIQSRLTSELSQSPLPRMGTVASKPSAATFVH